MKKLIFPCIIFLIILTANVSLASTATVNVTAVRIRESASTDSKIITNIYEDDEVEILEENGEWYKVKYKDKEGYAKAEFFNKKEETSANQTVAQNKENIQKPSATPTTKAPDNSQVGAETPVQTQNITQDLTVGTTVTLYNSILARKMPNLSTNANFEIAQNAQVAIQAKIGNWYKITDQNVTGWVTGSKFTQATTKVEQIVAQEPEPQPEEPITNTVEPPKPQVTEVPENNQTVENPVPEPTVEETPKQEQTPTETIVNKTAIVIVETARVRESASTTAKIIEMLDEDDIVTITGEEGEFYKISTNSIPKGYVSKKLVKQKDVTSRGGLEERKSTENSEKQEEPKQVENVVSNQESAIEESKQAVTGKDVVEFAKKFLGYKYVLGCSTPEDGFDCSGFTRYVFKNFGYKLGQVAANQTSVGDVVERENLQTGDLILFYNDAKTKIGHCGIFMENGDFIHSANPQRGVVIDNLNTNSYYRERFVTARRIVEK